MGNLITAGGSVFAPFLTTEVLIPFIYNPIRFNNIPFVQPSTLKYMFWYLFFNCVIVFFLGTIGGTMSSLKECDKMNILTSMNGAKWPVLFTIFGLLFLFMFPIIKAPLLVVTGMIPHSNLLVTGIFLSFFVLLGGFLGNRYTRTNVCKIKD